MPTLIKSDKNEEGKNIVEKKMTEAERKAAALVVDVYTSSIILSLQATS